MNKMEVFSVIARVAGKSYMVEVASTSSGGAEHILLDLSVCGRHAYGVEGSQAFRLDEQDTDTFKDMSACAQAVSMEAFTAIVAERNAQIIRADRREHELREKTARIAKLRSEVDALQADVDRLRRMAV